METEIWKYDTGRYKIYVENRDLKNKLMSWKECIRHCVYSHMSNMRAIGWDFIFPREIYNRVAKLVGLPPKAKDAEKVAHGKKLGALAVANDHLHLQIQVPGATYANDRQQIQPSGCVLCGPAINNGGKVC